MSTFSIVGIDRSKFAYNKAKLAVEQFIKQSNLPWTILRTTQFHTLVLGIIKAAEEKSASPLIIPSGLRFQSIEHTEVAQRLVELAEQAPAGYVPDMGGPQILTLEEMAEIYLRVNNKPGPVQPEALPSDLFATFRSGVNIIPDQKVGHIAVGGISAPKKVTFIIISNYSGDRLSRCLRRPANNVQRTIRATNGSTLKKITLSFAL